MLASYEEVMQYLLERDWVTHETVVGGNVALLNASRRNGNFEVLNGAGPHYFIKQETRDRGGGNRRLATVAYEAAVYRAIATVYAERPVFSCFPRQFAFDGDEHLLILEASEDWETLADHHLRLGRFSCSIAATLAAALADLHRISGPDRERIEACIGASEAPPWVFFLAEPDQWVASNSSAANIELIEILQGTPALCRSLERLRQQWRNSAFIHGDVRWDNCLVPRGRPSHRSRALKLVDWELARIGDPCWDLGTVFSEYVHMWLASVPLSAEHPPDQFLVYAHLPLARMQPALRAFWSTYWRRMPIASGELAQWLGRATSFAGVRLVQTAFEQLQVEPAITARSIYLLQLCSNIVARPLEAAVQLLGLPLPQDAHDDLQLC